MTHSIRRASTKGMQWYQNRFSMYPRNRVIPEKPILPPNRKFLATPMHHQVASFTDSRLGTRSRDVQGVKILREHAFPLLFRMKIWYSRKLLRVFASPVACNKRTTAYRHAGQKTMEPIRDHLRPCILWLLVG